jgi:hypothetical protein
MSVNRHHVSFEEVGDLLYGRRNSQLRKVGFGLCTLYVHSIATFGDINSSLFFIVEPIDDALCCYTMKSRKRTTVAIVRDEIGLSVEDFAKLIGKHVATIKSLEAGSGRLALSGATAIEISKRTGVSAAWLLDGNIRAKPVDQNGRPWNWDVFSEVFYGCFHIQSQEETINEAVSRLRSILMNQIGGDVNEHIRAITRTWRFLADMEKDFGDAKKKPSPPSSANARRAGGRKSASPMPRRRDVRASG